jgi:predicted enzyme related to lactoylglutathione lyase
VACRLVALCIDAHDPARLANFWAGVLGWSVSDQPHNGVILVPGDGTEFDIHFHPTQAMKIGPNQMHFDLTSSSLEDQQQTVARALELGARPFDVGQGPDARHVVLIDPEENEFCIIEPGNNFLDRCGFIGALAGDGSEEAGHFWSEALGWPLVWNQDQETAIQSPRGGTKITWGGPPLTPKTGKYRWHLDLAPSILDDQRTEVDRLISLGATPIDIGQGDVSWVVMTDPDGHEFCVLTPR